MTEPESAPTQRYIPPADALPVRSEATIGFRIARLTLGPLFRLVFRVRISGRENIPKTGPYVLIANHLNWPDPFMLLLAFPTEPRLHFLGDPENLVKNRLHWWAVRQIGGYVPVDLRRRADQLLVAQVRRCLDAGAVVVIFPEAAYGHREGELLDFKKGFAHFAIDARVPVLPVGLIGNKDLWLRKTLELRVGSRIDTAGLSGDELLALGRQRILDLLPTYEEPPGWKPLRGRLTRLFY